MTEELRKCSRCRCHKTLDNFSVSRLGKQFKTCDKCRERARKKCEHNRERNRCKDCGGGSICEHNRQRCKCKECGGSGICEHDRQRCKCKECGGASICEHNRIRSTCKECGGSRICEHNRERSTCKECDPSGHLANIVRSCVHNALKSKKSKCSIQYLGCQIDEFKKHIEEQFTEGMTWDNYGKWHIDHIIPIKYDNPTFEEVCERLHYKNTQPMWASENISKGNRYVGAYSSPSSSSVDVIESS